MIYIALGSLLLVYVIVKATKPAAMKIEKEKRRSYWLPAIGVLATAGVALSFKNGLWEVRAKEGLDREKLKQVMQDNWTDIKKLPGIVVDAVQSILNGAQAIYQKGVQFMKPAPPSESSSGKEEETI